MDTAALTETSNKTAYTGNKERALSLLGVGTSPEVVASALGVSPAYISQLLADEEFAKQVVELKFASLQKHNLTDATYDDMEAQLQKQFQAAMPLLMRPMEILKAMTLVNGMKRRGQSAPESITHQNTVVNLYMPVKVTQKFTTNVHNQVIKTGDKELLTVQSSAMEKLSAARASSKQLAGPGSSNQGEISDVEITNSATSTNLSANG